MEGGLVDRGNSRGVIHPVFPNGYRHRKLQQPFVWIVVDVIFLRRGEILWDTGAYTKAWA